MEAPEHLQVLAKPLLHGGGGGGDHFLVEDLLDFSNDDEGEEIAFGSAADESSSAAAPQLDCSSTSPASAPDSHFLGDSALSEEICVPYDELAELEWLSHFVEDSFSSDSSSHPKLQNIPSTTTITTTHSSTATVANYITTPPSPPLFSPDPPVRSARSKRSRAPPRDWASRLLVLTPSSIPPEASLLSPPPPPPPPSTPPPKKPAKASSVKKQGHLLEPSLAPNPDGRKCLHCATDRTPQWRTGPMGPKTLCNACGVRYKSGRLVPEYRPAASPTFVLSKHSNSHRKVMELRRQKEIQHQQPPQSGGGLGVSGGMFAVHYQQQGAGGFYDGGDDFLIHNHLVPDFRQLI